MGKLYMKKENRDREYFAIPKKDRKQFRRTSTRNQLLHPMYVEDYPRKLTPEEKGFGNTIYKTHFSVLYEIVEVVDYAGGR